MSNFVIMFDSQEGSSAIIQSLHLNRGIFVVGFEHLDYYSISERVQHDGIDVATLLDNAFKFGEAPGWKARKRFRAGRATGFKWRPFGGREAIDALVRNECLVFHLLRRNALKRALSILLGKAGFGKQSLQFELLDMRQQQKREFLAKVRAVSISLEASPIADAVTSYTRAVATIWENYGLPLKMRGISVIPIAYEDFCANRLDFMNRIALQIGAPRFLWDPSPKFVKVFGVNVESNVSNWPQICDDQRIRHAVEKHEDYIQKIFAEGQALTSQSRTWSAWSEMMSKYFQLAVE